MASNKVYRAIGLMSGTALDGEVDVALIETDGLDYVKPLDFKPFRYEDHIRDIVRSCFGKRERDAQVKKAEEAVTDIHIRAVKTSGFQADIIGFHGQTITHDPANRFTLQIGDGQRLARETGIDVVADMRQADIKAGGQGAPLLPLYHRARTANLEKPVAILNIGGVANITYIEENKILAFDCGPGNALMDDYIRLKTGCAYDRDGSLAAKGKVQEDLIKRWLDHPYFYKAPPKSLDRNAWDIERDLNGLSTEDALASLMEFTARAITHAEEKQLLAAAQWYACGGGRHNKALMDRLDKSLIGGIKPVEALGWNGDATEAEGFAYLAVRSLLGLPLTEPSTTGVPEAITGGIFYKAKP